MPAIPTNAPREDLIRRIDGLASHLLAIFQHADGNPRNGRRSCYADGKGSLAGCSLNVADLRMIRRALIEYTGQDPLDTVDVGPISDKDPI